ncbi:MAG TPA: ATP-dependent helicase C-terminal domain-containing protein, partial [Planctomycetota bacterium]|nr:ATP-dependent helicase C-terminal domain-containing protein [Planctomycetota bacterium]
LDGVDCVILDEFHERSLHADLALALLREVRATARPELRVAIMSATLDSAPASRFLGGAPVVEGEGRPYPVEVRHLAAPDRSPLPEAAARAVRECWDGSRGHVLVFLPGIGEIRRTARELEGFARSSGAVILPLHGALSLDEQVAALGPTAERKIVLSTNIAETSLTIEGVDLVIDCGFARVLRNDPRHGIDRLELSRVSKHSAEQRSGRAGRLGPGRALRLWTLAEHAALPDDEAPEVRRVDLASTVLELRAWGVTDPAAFQWFEAPEPAALERAEALLEALGATAGAGGALTAEGRLLLAIPAHPRLARLLLAARAGGALRDGALAAALIEERDILPLDAGSSGARGTHIPREAGPSDILLRIDLFEEAERSGFRRGPPGGPPLDLSAARAVARARDALLRSAREAFRETEGTSPLEGDASGEVREAALLRAILRAYPDRVARRRERGSRRGRMVGGRGVTLLAESVVEDSALFVAVEVDEPARSAGAPEARVRIASAVRREWIEDAFPEHIEERIETFFDAGAGKVRSTAAVRYRDLPLEEPREMRPPPADAARILEEAARPRAEEIFLGHEAARAWILRARSLAGWMPELGLPALGPPELQEAIAGACTGKTSLDDLSRSDLLGLLRGRLPHAVAAAVDRHAPETVQVPSGSRVRLLYEPGRPPVLAVRLQELFGLADTPAVAGGRVPVLLHLLGPNFRPVQITQDLRSFWNTTYAQVRKDLRARYPKHAWPEDPWTAAPRARPGRPPRRGPKKA